MNCNKQLFKITPHCYRKKQCGISLFKWSFYVKYVTFDYEVILLLSNYGGILWELDLKLHQILMQEKTNDNQ
jgi:hypothetical protein